VNSPERSKASNDALLQRLQQENQRRILGKLLHDLRNPVHSLRITIELFSRLARRNGDVDALMERAGRYVGPADAALQSLVVVTNRFGLYLSPPAPPQIDQVDVRECLDEIALLLGGAGRPNGVKVQAEATGDTSLRLEADRARLSHVLLQLCGSSERGVIELNAKTTSAEIAIEVIADLRTAMTDFSAEELAALIQDAGGTMVFAPDRAILRFKALTSP
jgi:hypothetical protein